MLKKYFALSLIVLLTFGCRTWGVRGSGDLKTEKRSISDFSELSISGAFIVKIQVGGEPKLEITTDDNILPYIITKVKGNTLIIDSRKSLNPKNRIKVTVSTPYLESVESSGANTIFVRGIDSERFNVDISGASRLELEGKTNKMTVDLSGASSLAAFKLAADKVIVDLSGASSAEIYAKEELNADLSGASSVEFKGNPRIRKDISGAASIRSRN
ncbi:MAG: DUF2807 domain-containing protein [Bacteroidetes bacterium]|nr:DUF2807 domain-containing protein [Bacteroidota bacterium]